MATVSVAAEQTDRPDIPPDPLRTDETERVGVLKKVERKAWCITAIGAPLREPVVECFENLFDGDVGSTAADVANDAIDAVDLVFEDLPGQVSILDGYAATLHWIPSGSVASGLQGSV
jgi:hypothetical protein